jgi:DNA polymerase epsilon subunit 2
MELKAQIQSSFKLSGLSVRVEASRYLAGLLEPVPPEDRQAWVDKILDQVQTHNLKSSVIEKEVLAAAVRECTSQEPGGASTARPLTVISAFETPRLTYSIERKKYLSDEASGRPPPQLLAPAESKAIIFSDRYAMLHQRTARHDLFDSTKPQTGQAAAKRYQLKAVEFLLGTTNRMDDVIVLGMLTQLSHGTFSLEDPSGVVKVDLSETKFHTGLYTENCFVLAEGWYDDGVFHVMALGFPPAETSQTTRAYFGSINFFGGGGETSAKASTVLAELEATNSEAMIVFLSDVWLDLTSVMDRLRKLLQGYSAFPPTAFVLCGNFLSSPGESGYAARLREHLKLLGELIAEFPQLAAESQFLLVPGPADPGSPNIFPRPALPAHLTAELARLVPSARFLTNPARVQYCTQEIVIFREDIATKLCRNAIHFPESGEVPDHFAKTITCQGHLAPLPLHTCPVHWDHDRALYLYPLPDLVVTADKYEPFTAENLGCKVINPGPFAKHDFSFKTYVPSSRTVEDSQVPGE